MKKTLWLTFISLLLLITAIPPATSALSQNEDETREMDITEWLLLGPFTNPLPALLEEYQKEQLIENLIRFQQVDRDKLRPVNGDSLQWHDGSISRWREIQSGDKGISLIGEPTWK
jgi:hypothetical protein